MAVQMMYMKSDWSLEAEQGVGLSADERFEAVYCGAFGWMSACLKKCRFLI